MDLRHFVCTENVDAIVPQNIIYIETFTYIIDPNNIKLKCIKIISQVSLYTQHRHVL
jgi:hypothetical protein